MEDFDLKKLKQPIEIEMEFDREDFDRMVLQEARGCARGLENALKEKDPAGAGKYVDALLIILRPEVEKAKTAIYARGRAEGLREAVSFIESLPENEMDHLPARTLVKMVAVQIRRMIEDAEGGAKNEV
ncbi:MAG: hypothetical protein IJU70_11980 [Lentisphaeria bacterium]|nr:hypothetical protein [Lentisphaeria bacterium]